MTALLDVMAVRTTGEITGAPDSLQAAALPRAVRASLGLC